ncbi:hypothetical protein SBBP2_190016 [Burkholderiales bacterium]|nr:hypothetical protein SBBP2_190016 [Burkholderiales bacterium]
MRRSWLRKMQRCWTAARSRSMRSWRACSNGIAAIEADRSRFPGKRPGFLGAKRNTGHDGGISRVHLINSARVQDLGENESPHVFCCHPE